MSTTGSPPVRYPSGVSTSAPNYVYSNFPEATPPRLNEYFTDFNNYVAGDWTVTTAGAGTTALSDGNGGLLTVTTDAGGTAVQGNELVAKSFKFTSGSQMWFSINVNFGANATQNAFMAGVSNTFAALTPTDGVYFSKAAASTTMQAIVRGSSTSTTMTVGTVAVNTPYTFSFYYDGKPTPTLYFYSTIGLTTPTAFGAPYYTGGNQAVAVASSEAGATNTLANLPTADLRGGFALKSGAATFTGVAVIDFVHWAEEVIGRF